jgi:ADP-ribose pyrophosphatase
MTQKEQDTATVHHRHHVHRGRVIDVGTEDVTLPGGVRTTLDVIRHPGAACVLPVSDDGVALIRQFRHCAGGWLWEAPAGTLEPGEAPLACAHRELAEEAGLATSAMTLVGSTFTAPGFTDERIHLFVATGCRPVATRRDHDEVITDVRSFTTAGIDALLQSGELTDAKTLCVLLFARTAGLLPLATAS